MSGTDAYANPFANVGAPHPPQQVSSPMSGGSGSTNTKSSFNANPQYGQQSQQQPPPFQQGGYSYPPPPQQQQMQQQMHQYQGQPQYHQPPQTQYPVQQLPLPAPTNGHPQQQGGYYPHHPPPPSSSAAPPQPPAVSSTVPPPVDPNADPFGIFTQSPPTKEVSNRTMDSSSLSSSANNHNTATNYVAPRDLRDHHEPIPSGGDGNCDNDRDRIPTAMYRSPRSTTSSRSSRSGIHAANSPLYDPAFAPPPVKPQGISRRERLQTAMNEGTPQSALPRWDLIKHSGNLLARISVKTLLIKKWKQIFWISYGDNQILIFRNQADFEEWALNPYLSSEDRHGLVKLSIDFRNDLYKPGVRGYRSSHVSLKEYGKQGMLHSFKMEQWMYYGPVIAAAFASKSQIEIQNIHTICKEMMKKYKQNLQFKSAEDGGGEYSDYASSYYESEAQSYRSGMSNTSGKSNGSKRSLREKLSITKSDKSFDGNANGNNGYASDSGSKRSLRDRFSKKDKSSPNYDANGNLSDSGSKHSLRERIPSFKSSKSKNNEERDRKNMAKEYRNGGNSYHSPADEYFNRASGGY